MATSGITFKQVVYKVIIRNTSSFWPNITKGGGYEERKVAVTCKQRMILEDTSKADLKDLMSNESITDNMQNESITDNT